MPNRIIREGMIESEQVNQLTADAERFFVRLMLKADDFGRFTGNPLLIKAALFPLKPEVRITDISRWIAECEKAGLVRCYQFSGKPYLAIPRFGQRTRAEKSKYPDPPFSVEHADDCPSPDGQMTVNGQTAAHVVVDVVEDGGVVGEPARKRASRLPKPFVLSTEWCEEAEKILADLKRSDIVPAYEFAKFCDHWWSKSGKDAAKEDWLATWRNWIRKACEYKRPASVGQPSDTTAAWLELRAAVRDQQPPKDSRLRKVIEKFGGLYKLGERSSKDLDFMRKDFDREFVSA